jgi:hypothetical protein
MTYFTIEQIIIEKYINELSGDAFKTLLKIIYIARSNNDDINVRNTKMLQRILGVNSIDSTSVLNELVNYDVLIKREKQNKITYILNNKKIRQDNQIYSENNVLRPAKITIFSVQESKVLNEVVDEISDEVIKKKMRQVLASADTILIDNLLKTIRLIQKYNIEKERRFSFAMLAKFLVDISVFNVHLIMDVCQRYNNNPSIAGLRGSRYVLRMAEGISKEDPSYGIDENFTVENERRRQEGEIKFALKVVRGLDIDESAIYLKLKRNNVDELNRLWQIGADILRLQQKEDEIYYAYNWLKLKEVNNESKKQIS